MDQLKDSTGNGFLHGLKKILFQDATAGNSQSTQPATTHHQQATPQPATSTTSYDGALVKAEIQQKILQLLDARNKQGVDFLEVWRAAQDMGGADAIHIRMAFTSLKHADPSLSKDRLVQTAQAYISELESAFSQELAKREAERRSMVQQKESAKLNVQNAIRDLEEQVRSLQQVLETRRKEWQQMQQQADPGLEALDMKIRFGREAMDAVVHDIQTVLGIIQQEIN